MVTPDGCPVDVYARLPAEPELSVVLGHARGRSRVLDLGAGTGRIADPLCEAGLDVVAVDESAEMLAHVRCARTVLARVQDLDLGGERFDLVLMLSHLINTADAQERSAILRAARRHLRDDGLLLIQRHDPGWELRPGSGSTGDIGVDLLDVDVRELPIVRATTRYRLGEQSWDQPWSAEILDDAATETTLRAAGLELTEQRGAWVTARVQRAG